MGYRQVIIARKDLQMGPGKLAAQVAHASLAYFTTLMKDGERKIVTNKYRAKDRNGDLMVYMNTALMDYAIANYQDGNEFFYLNTVGTNSQGFPIFEPTTEAQYEYRIKIDLEKEIYEQWVKGAFTKTVCAAKNKNQLLKVVEIANEMGLERDKDYFLIYDNCLTELEPEEANGRTLTCIGFKPMEDEQAWAISKKYQLYQ